MSLHYRDFTSPRFSPGGSQGMSSLGGIRNRFGHGGSQLHVRAHESVKTRQENPAGEEALTSRTRPRARVGFGVSGVAAGEARATAGGAAPRGHAWAIPAAHAEEAAASLRRVGHGTGGSGRRGRSGPGDHAGTRHGLAWEWLPQLPKAKGTGSTERYVIQIGPAAATMQTTLTFHSPKQHEHMMKRASFRQRNSDPATWSTY